MAHRPGESESQLRASHEEMIELGRVFSSRLNLAKGPVVVAVPLLGLSIPNVPGGPLLDREVRQVAELAMYGGTEKSVPELLEDLSQRFHQRAR